ncbi:hypothetical protein KI387_018588, partial [Taxus chinensis]
VKEEEGNEELMESQVPETQPNQLTQQEQSMDQQRKEDQNQLVFIQQQPISNST